MTQQLDLFRCDKYAMSLTTAACSKFHRMENAQTRQPWSNRFHCRTCAIGAANAAGTAVVVLDTAASARQVVRDEWRKVCPRCLRLSSRIIHGHLCVSCYNRTREFRLGRNRKGTRPRIALHAEAISVITATGHRVEVVHDVVDPIEAMVSLARQADGAIGFGRVPYESVAGFVVGSWNGKQVQISRQLELRL